jgi:hypothetical protein
MQTNTISLADGAIGLYGLKFTAASLFAMIRSGGPAPRAYTVGLFSNLKNLVRGTRSGLDVHHVGQKAVMKVLIAGYDEANAPAILVSKFGHTKSIPGVGIVSRSTEGITCVRDLIARDILELRRVYPNIPNSSLQEFNTVE